MLDVRSGHPQDAVAGTQPEVVLLVAENTRDGTIQRAIAGRVAGQTRLATVAAGLQPVQPFLGADEKALLIFRTRVKREDCACPFFLFGTGDLRDLPVGTHAVEAGVCSDPEDAVDVEVQRPNAAVGQPGRGGQMGEHLIAT